VKLDIRDLKEEDAATLGGFFERNDVPDVTADFHPFPLNRETAIRICSECSKDRFFAGWRGGSLIGFAMLRGWEDGYETPSFGILVDRAFSGNGVGTALTHHALGLAIHLGCPAVRLTVHPENHRAIHLYEKAGFQMTDTLPDGRLVMLCRLAAR
jgi:ribosomal protein S18 acetylase RimI-like enzyme